MKKRCLTLFLALLLLAALWLPAAAAEEDWKSAYAQAIRENTDAWGCGVQLVDLDMDGTPELLIGTHPGTGLFSVLTAAYTFKNGSLQKLETAYEENHLSTGAVDAGGRAYVLYRNNESGAYKLEGGMTFRAGMDYYDLLTCNFSLNAGKLGYSTSFQESVYGAVTKYYVEGAQVVKGSYETAFQNRHAGWTKVEGFGYGEVWTQEQITEQEIQTLLEGYAPGPVLAVKSSHKVTVNGQAVQMAAYNIGGNNYFKLRDVAMALKDSAFPFSLGWNGAEKRIALTTGGTYTAVGGELAGLDGLPRFGKPTDAALYADGSLRSPAAYNIEGNNYYKLRDIADIVGFGLIWNAADSTVVIVAELP